MDAIEKCVRKVMLQTQFCTHGLECTECCFTYTGSVSNGGYGTIYCDELRRPMMTHRLMWMWWTGQYDLSRSVTVNHLCRNRRCWQLSHLYESNQKENMMDRRLNDHGVDLIAFRVPTVMASEGRYKAKKLLLLLMELLGLTPDQAVEVLNHASSLRGAVFEATEDEIEAMNIYRQLMSDD